MEAANRNKVRAKQEPEPEVLVNLAPRQLEALKLAAKGFTAVESARLMGCSVKTVECHLSKVRERWDASSTTEAAVMAAKRGIL